MHSDTKMEKAPFYEAIHNQVASGICSFDMTYMLCIPVFYIETGFVFKYFLFRDSYLSF